MDEVTLKIPKISCEGWLPPIQKAVSQVSGVEWIGGDWKAKTISLRYAAEETVLSEVYKALVSAGYPAADWSISRPTVSNMSREKSIGILAEEAHCRG